MKVIDNGLWKSHLGRPSTLFTVNKRVELECPELFQRTVDVWEITAVNIKCICILTV